MAAAANGSGSGTAEVAVVIAAKDATATIGPLLDALEAQTLPRERFEAIVVDDGSSDGTGALVEARGWARVVALGENRGAPVARNAGVAAARAPLVAFTDADCVPDADWLERGLGWFDRDPELQMLGGLVFVEMGPRPTVSALIDGARFLNQEEAVKGGGGLTSNLWLWRELFLSVNGFNENLAKLGYPDTELAELLSSRGVKYEYAEEVRVAHDARATWRELGRKGYRLGVAHAPFRRNRRAPGGTSGRPIFLSPKRLLPRATLRRIDRLAKRGIRVGPLKRCQMFAVETACVSVPMLTGDLIGTWRQFRASR